MREIHPIWTRSRLDELRNGTKLVKNLAKGRLYSTVLH